MASQSSQRHSICFRSSRSTRLIHPSLAISLSSVLLMGNLIPCWGQTDPSIVGKWDFIRPADPVKWRSNFYDLYDPVQYPNGKDQKSPHASAFVLLPALTLNPQNEQQQVLNQVLTIGGFPGSSNCDAYTTTEILDFSSGLPARCDGASMSYGLGHVIAVLLPNGKVFVLGGQSIKDTEEGESEDGCNWDYNSMVLQTELDTLPTSSNDPGSFSALAAADGSDRDADNNCGSTTNKPDLGYRTKDGSRVYHSSAVLLGDGRVLVVGTDAGDPPCLSGCTDTECTHPEAKSLYPAIYTPPYLLKPDGSLRVRPQITSVSETELGYQETFSLKITLGESDSIKSVVLILPGGSTHSVSFDQRLVNCNFTYSGGDTVTVKAFWNAHIAPPGYYLLFVVDEEGIPSVAQWVHLWVP